MIYKILDTAATAVEGTPDEVVAVVMLGSFSLPSQASELTDALIAQGARDLTIVSNHLSNGEMGLAALFKKGEVEKSCAAILPKLIATCLTRLTAVTCQNPSLFRKVVWLNAFALLARVSVAFSPPQTLGPLLSLSPGQFSQLAYERARRNCCGW